MPLTSAILRWRILALADAASAERRRSSRLTNLSRRRFRVLARSLRDPFHDLSEREFIKTYRLSKPLMRDLIGELSPFISGPRRSDGLSRKIKILTAIAFYATGSYQTLVGQSSCHNVSQTSVSRAVRQVTNALNEIYPRHVRWPVDEEGRNRIKAKFYARFKIPGVLGCIDGTHVAIVRPEQHEERFFNRKGYHSLNTMIICDSDLNILAVDASSPGAAHDLTVWQSNPLCRNMEELNADTEQAFLLGDSGYTLRTTIMTPILDTVPGTPEHNYYTMHVSARNTVERCIGCLKARFRCLLVARTLHYDPITAGKIINACCVLHNIANRHRVPYTPLTPDEWHEERRRQCQVADELRTEARELIRAPDNNRRVNPELQRGRSLRQALVNKLWRDRRV